MTMVSYEQGRRTRRRLERLERLESAALSLFSARGLEATTIQQITDAADVEVSVSDMGPGLVGEVEQKIFEPFFTTKATGTGLGLAISRSIIKAHDARLGYRANQPRGACFYFVLPAHQETLP